jgi:hypothetical protein
MPQNKNDQSTPQEADKTAEVGEKIPNATTREAIDEARAMRKERE